MPPLLLSLKSLLSVLSRSSNRRPNRCRNRSRCPTYNIERAPGEGGAVFDRPCPQEGGGREKGRRRSEERMRGGEGGGGGVGMTRENRGCISVRVLSKLFSASPGKVEEVVEKLGKVRFRRKDAGY